MLSQIVELRQDEVNWGLARWACYIRCGDEMVDDKYDFEQLRTPRNTQNISVQMVRFHLGSHCFVSRIAVQPLHPGGCIFL